MSLVGITEKLNLEKEDGKKDRSIWVRNNFNFNKRFTSEEIISVNKNSILTTIENELKIDQSSLKISIKLIIRRYKNNFFLCTACLVNETSEGKKQDAISLFQSSLQIEVIDQNGVQKKFYPYPKSELEIELENEKDLEIQNLELIYNSNQTFSIGHGCASDWIIDSMGEAKTIIGNHFPIFNSPNFKPDLLKSGDIEMKTLACIGENKEWEPKLLNILKEYEDWIEEKNSQIPNLNKELQQAAMLNIEKCKLCMQRISEGIIFLKENELALQAFKWG